MDLTTNNDNHVNSQNKDTDKGSYSAKACILSDSGGVFCINYLVKQPGELKTHTKKNCFYYGLANISTDNWQIWHFMIIGIGCSVFLFSQTRTFSYFLQITESEGCYLIIILELFDFFVKKNSIFKLFLIE